MTRTSIRSVLAASDLGTASDKVVRSAAALAQGLGADLHVLHVLNLDVLPSVKETGASYLDRPRQAEQFLAEQVSTVAPDVRPASLRVVNFAVHEAILARATEVSADLIVVGPHRGGDVGAHLLGTTADHVVRAAEVPCLVASASLALPVRRLAVPTDFSEPSGRALTLALDLAVPLSEGRAEVRVLHVGSRVERADIPDLEEKQLRPRVEREIQDAVAHSEEPFPLAVKPEVVWGASPAAEIVQYAQKAEVDLLVLGSQGEGGIKRLLIGSVASGVARQAPCPVLIVPARRA